MVSSGLLRRENLKSYMGAVDCSKTVTVYIPQDVTFVVTTMGISDLTPTSAWNVH
jgi:hypothetical protein